MESYVEESEVIKLWNVKHIIMLWN
jgi:hypothetical protein